MNACVQFNWPEGIEIYERESTFVNRYVAQAALAEKIGAVNTQTVSTDRGIFKEFSILQMETMWSKNLDTLNTDWQILQQKITKLRLDTRRKRERERPLE